MPVLMLIFVYIYSCTYTGSGREIGKMWQQLLHQLNIYDFDIGCCICKVKYWKCVYMFKEI